MVFEVLVLVMEKDEKGKCRWATRSTGGCSRRGAGFRIDRGLQAMRDARNQRPSGRAEVAERVERRSGDEFWMKPAPGCRCSRRWSGFGEMGKGESGRVEEVGT